MNKPLTIHEAEIIARTPQYHWPKPTADEADDVLARSFWPGEPVRRSVVALDDIWLGLCVAVLIATLTVSLWTSLENFWAVTEDAAMGAQ